MVWYLTLVARERTILIRSMNEILANPESLGRMWYVIQAYINSPGKIATFAREGQVQEKRKRSLVTCNVIVNKESRYKIYIYIKYICIYIYVSGHWNV